jgi:hypothetical protein
MMVLTNMRPEVSVPNATEEENGMRSTCLMAKGAARHWGHWRAGAGMRPSFDWMKAAVKLTASCDTMPLTKLIRAGKVTAKVVT